MLALHGIGALDCLVMPDVIGHPVLMDCLFHGNDKKNPCMKFASDFENRVTAGMVTSWAIGSSRHTLPRPT